MNDLIPLQNCYSDYFTVVNICLSPYIVAKLMTKDRIGFAVKKPWHKYLHAALLWPNNIHVLLHAPVQLCIAQFEASAVCEPGIVSNLNYLISLP